MAGKAVSASLVSCMHRTSGCALGQPLLDPRRRAFSELTFQVARRTPPTLADEPPDRVRGDSSRVGRDDPPEGSSTQRFLAGARRVRGLLPGRPPSSWRGPSSWPGRAWPRPSSCAGAFLAAAFFLAGAFFFAAFFLAGAFLAAAFLGRGLLGCRLLLGRGLLGCGLLLRGGLPALLPSLFLLCRLYGIARLPALGPWIVPTPGMARSNPARGVERLDHERVGVSPTESSSLALCGGGSPRLLAAGSTAQPSTRT